MSKRLYQIVDTETQEPIPDLYFSDMRLAKAKRQELCGEHYLSQTPRYIVSPGPDHRHFQG